MASASAVAREQSDILVLLEQYCSKRSRQTSPCRAQWKKLESGQRFSSTGPIAYAQGPAFSRPKETDTDSTEEPNDVSPSRLLSAVADRLVEINESAPIPEVVVEDQDEIVQKLVELMMTFGDDVNMKIHQSPVLQAQISNLNYDTFQKLTSSIQNLVQMGLAAESEEQIEQQKISWAFEVTSRLSAISIVQRRRVLTYGDQYIQQHHAAWVQEQGGWEVVFDVD